MLLLIFLHLQMLVHTLSALDGSFSSSVKAKWVLWKYDDRVSAAKEV